MTEVNILCLALGQEDQGKAVIVLRRIVHSVLKRLKITDGGV